jgi:hypothetical protein
LESAVVGRVELTDNLRIDSLERLVVNVIERLHIVEEDVKRLNYERSPRKEAKLHGP